MQEPEGPQMRKAVSDFSLTALELLVGTAGFELATPCTPCKAVGFIPFIFNDLRWRSLQTVRNEAQKCSGMSPRSPHAMAGSEGRITNRVD